MVTLFSVSTTRGAATTQHTSGDRQLRGRYKYLCSPRLRWEFFEDWGCFGLEMYWGEGGSDGLWGWDWSKTGKILADFDGIGFAKVRAMRYRCEWRWELRGGVVREWDTSARLHFSTISYYSRTPCFLDDFDTSPRLDESRFGSYDTPFTTTFGSADTKS
jgi:hypothetical protein